MLETYILIVLLNLHLRPNFWHIAHLALSCAPLVLLHILCYSYEIEKVKGRHVVENKR